jgi:hypothetical protein
MAVIDFCLENFPFYINLIFSKAYNQSDPMAANNLVQESELLVAAINDMRLTAEALNENIVDPPGGAVITASKVMATMIKQFMGHWKRTMELSKRLTSMEAELQMRSLQQLGVVIFKRKRVKGLMSWPRNSER